MDSRRMCGPGPALTFVRAAWRYWVAVWPLVSREVSRWRARAEAIPDRSLRATAIQNLRDERGNLEGAAAFAVLAPSSWRPSLIRPLVAFQAAYDYVDTLVETPGHAAPAANRRLHQALYDAVDHRSDPSSSYYVEGLVGDDAGYLPALVTTCQRAVAALPSNATVLPHALAAVERMIEYQVRNHAVSATAAASLAGWATAETPAESDFRWWETAASAASSLVVFALLAQATRDGVSEGEAERVVDAYSRAGALHVLLDSFADRRADALTGDHSLVAHYVDPDDEARRLAGIAEEAFARTRLLADGSTHALILAAMASFYLTATVGAPEERLTVEHVVEALGAFALPTILVLRARRVAARLVTVAKTLVPRIRLNVT